MGSVPGAWLGFTEFEDNLLYSNPGNHIAARLLPSGSASGRLNIRTRVGGETTTTSTFSASADALTIVAGRDYDLTLQFNFETLIATFTATDTISLISTSISTTLPGAPTLTRGQFDFTGMESDTETADAPYFKSISVIPEPSNYALLSGCLALVTLMLHRRK